MRRLLALAVVILALSAPGMAHAHFIWIEAASVGKPEAAMEISLFYGEPHEFLREESPGNLDRHAGLQAWVVDPSGERTPLTLRKEKNRFATTFRPTRVGRHTIIASSTDVTPVDLTTYGKGTVRAVFFARSQFLVFEPGRLSERDRELGGLLEYDIVPITRGIDARAGTLSFLPGHELLVRFLTKTQPTARVRLQAQGRTAGSGRCVQATPGASRASCPSGPDAMSSPSSATSREPESCRAARTTRSASV